jgi:HTH-type transcriptional regulator / antitoxin HigA
VDIRPIRSDADLDAALRRIETLWNPNSGSPEEDEFDILTALVERYETDRWPMPGVRGTGVEYLKRYMQLAGRTQAELGKLLGSRSRASEIMHGRKRHLTVDQIRTIGRAWNVPIECLVGELVEG